MVVTKEQVHAKAKELNITVSDDQAEVFVSLGVLPSAESGTPPGDGGDDDDNSGDDKDGKVKRIKQLAAEKKALKKQLEDFQAKVTLFEQKEADAARKKDEDAGNYAKLQKDAEDAKVKAEGIAKKAKERFQATAINSAIETALLEAGVEKDRLSDAVRLFDSSKVEFSWKDEEALDYEVEEFGSVVEEFKKKKPFLFSEEESGGGGDFKPRKPGSPPPKPNEKKAEELKRLFPALRR